MIAKERLRELAAEIKILPDQDASLEGLLRRVETHLRLIFGSTTPHLEALNDVKSKQFAGLQSTTRIRRWRAIRNGTVAILEAAIEELDMIDSGILPSRGSPIDPSRAAFIVHGHDRDFADAVARVLDSQRIRPVILDEQAGGTSTIIEKLEEHSDVPFAVVLITPDDHLIESSSGDDVPVVRARQNVLLEMGFFMGRLGRRNVVVLYKKADGFDMPSDLGGVTYIEADSSGLWKHKLEKELDAAGLLSVREEAR